MKLRRLLGLACISASACTTKAEPPAADSPVNSSPEAGGAAHVNMIRLDTAKSGKTAPVPKSPARQTPAPIRRDTAIVLRDSASGPRMQIDSKGKATPIKK